MEAVACRSQSATILHFSDRPGAGSERLEFKCPTGPDKQVEALHRASQLIEQVTVQFPVSEIVAPLTETFDWIQGQFPDDQDWIEGVQRRFDERWEAVAGRALTANPRQVSDGALADADYDPFGKGHPLGVELTRVVRTVLDELGPISTQAAGILPDTVRAQAHTRAIETQPGGYVLPVVAYSPLLDSEWNAILDQLDEVVRLALAFEGAAVVWLIGGLARDVEGRLQLRPKLSLDPPAAGTRVRPVRVLLGTPYEEQCPSLLPLVEAAHSRMSLSAALLLSQAKWHRLVVQLGVPAEYAFLDLNTLSRYEREIAQGIVRLGQNPREPHRVKGEVHELPRPWAELAPDTDEPAPLAPTPPVDLVAQAPLSRNTQTLLQPGIGMETDELLPPAVQQPGQPLPTPEPSTQSPVEDGLRRDAEDLRSKGMALATSDPSAARKYLLASTVLQKDNAQVWIALIGMANSAKEREVYRQQAGRILSAERESLTN